MSDFIQVTTAVDNMDDAQNIASAVVSQRLAACVQIIGPCRTQPVQGWVLHKERRRRKAKVD